MELQQALALSIVAVTAGVFVVKMIPRRSPGALKRPACHCSCSNGGEPARDTIVFRARKGERPTIVWKMK
jgi:hypothetical protein